MAVMLGLFSALGGSSDMGSTREEGLCLEEESLAGLPKVGILGIEGVMVVALLRSKGCRVEILWSYGQWQARLGWRIM